MSSGGHPGLVSRVSLPDKVLSGSSDSNKILLCGPSHCTLFAFFGISAYLLRNVPSSVWRFRPPGWGGINPYRVSIDPIPESVVFRTSFSIQEGRIWPESIQLPSGGRPVVGKFWPSFRLAISDPDVSPARYLTFIFQSWSRAPIVTNLGCVRGQYHTNNEQTQSVEGIIWINWFLQRGYSQLHNADEYRWLYTHFTQYDVSRIHGRILWHIPITTDDFISNTGHYRRRYTRFTQLCICPRNTLKIHGRVLWPKPFTTDDFIINTGHCRRLYTRFTQLCVTPQNALKIHGRVLWHKPITTDGFIFVSHYYWGAGRPK